MNELLGQKVWFTMQISKDVRHKDGVRITSHDSWRLHKIKTGIITGERWLPDGTSVRGWGEEPSQFTRTGSTHCLLVTEHIHKNAVMTDPKFTYVMGDLGISDLEDVSIHQLIEEKRNAV